MENKPSDNFYIVEAILQKRSNEEKVEYKVKWQGYPKEHNSWEPIENLTNATELIRKFEEGPKDSQGRSLAELDLDVSMEENKPKGLKRPYPIILDVNGALIKEIFTVHYINDMIHGLVLLEKDGVIKKGWVSTLQLKTLNSGMLIDFYEKRIVFL